MIMIEGEEKILKTEAEHLRPYKLKDNSTERQAAERQRVQLLVKDGQLIKAFLLMQVFLTKVLTLGLTKKFSGMSL